MQAGGAQGGSSGGGTTYRTLRTRRGGGVLSEINVTPLVDVVLVLLLVFMVTAPMMSRGIDVNLPVADQPEVEPGDRLTVTISADERITIGDKPINLLLLEDTMRGLLAANASKIVYLRADERVRYGRVVEVIDRLKRAGVEQFGLAYELPAERERR
jgi:biopolymer transport protein ExbD